MCRKWSIRVRLNVWRKVEEYCRNPDKSDEGPYPVTEMDIRTVDQL